MVTVCRLPRVEQAEECEQKDLIRGGIISPYSKMQTKTNCKNDNSLFIVFDTAYSIYNHIPITSRSKASESECQEPGVP